MESAHLLQHFDTLAETDAAPAKLHELILQLAIRGKLLPQNPKGVPATKRFLRIAINGRLDEMVTKAHGGVGLQHITKGKLELLVLPVPPLPEQKRIVATVEELLALCDALEARQTTARTTATHLLDAALAVLTTNP